MYLNSCLIFFLIPSLAFKFDNSISIGASFVSDTIASFTMSSIALSHSGCSAISRYLLSKSNSVL